MTLLRFFTVESLDTALYAVCMVLHVIAADDACVRASFTQFIFKIEEMCSNVLDFFSSSMLSTRASLFLCCVLTNSLKPLSLLLN